MGTNRRLEFLRGEKLRQRLAQLRDIVNEHHAKADRLADQWLDEVRLTGEALQEAYERTGRRKKWTRWLRTTCLAHYVHRRTISDYRFIANNWDQIQSFRRQDSSIVSIRRALKAFRDQNKPADEKQLQTARDELAKALNRSMRKLSDKEISVLRADFRICWDALRTAVRQAIEEAPNEERIKHEVRTRGTLAYNRLRGYVN